jgi:hypothetical protein
MLKARSAPPSGPVAVERGAPARWWALVSLCVLANVAEAAVVLLVGTAAGASIAPQAAAPAPLGLFSDMRWLLLYSRSWWSFAAWGMAAFAVRSLLTAGQVHLSWPGPRPPFRRLLARAAAFNLGAGILLTPLALILFAFAAFSVSWLYFAAVPSVVILSLLLYEGAVSPRWSRRAPLLRPAAWMAATVLAVTVGAGVVSLAPRPLAVPVAAAAGLYEAVAWRRIVGAVASASPSRFVPFSPSVLVVFVAGSVLGAAIGFSQGRVAPVHVGAPSTQLQIRNRPAVLVVEGFSSHWDGSAVTVPGAPPGAVVAVFSYRGQSPTGAPEPYPASATHTSLGHLAGLMAAQVNTLERETGQPVSIVAVSEGSAVTEAYLSAVAAPPVRTVVVISPLLDPGAVSLPPPGRAGRGMVASRGLELLSSWLAPIATVDLSPDQPFLRSLVTDGPRLALQPLCRPSCRGPREVQVVPLADTVAGSPSHRPGVDTVVFGGFHGGDFSNPTVRAALSAALGGRALPGSSADGLLSHVISGLASAWRVPSLGARA